MVVLTDPFVRELARLQAAEGASGEAFAGYLGVSPPTWSKVRRGKLRPSYRLVQGALARWPHLAERFGRLLTS